MTANSNTTETQLVPTQSYDLGKNQSLDLTVTSGQNISLNAGNASVKGATLNSAGELVISLTTGGTLVVKNFSQIAGMEKAPTITLSNGQVLNLAELLPTLANDVKPAAGDNAAEQQVLIEKPHAKEDLVVKLDADHNYKFGFAMADAKSVENNGGQLVISFADGGKIIIPNYGVGAHPATLLKFDGSLLGDVASTSSSQNTKMADLAQQLEQVEPAAGSNGGGAGGASPGGFGFQSTFQATPLESIAAIGPIAPTALQYVAPDRTYEPPADKVDPIVLHLTVTDSNVYEDGSTSLNISAVPDKTSQSVTVTITGFDPSWTVDTSSSGGTYNAATGTWTITMPAGSAFNGGPTVSPPANSDADMLGLQVSLSVSDSSTGQTASTGGVVNVYTDAVADVPNVAGANASGDEDTAIALNFSTSVSDTDGSETITKVLISGVPTGATLNHGTDQGGGVWLLTTADLTGLTITPPHNYSGTFPLTLTSTATETNLSGNEFDLTNNNATNAVTINVDVNAVADQPNLEVQNAQVKEDGSVALQINASLNDTDGSEVLTVSIAGFQPGWAVNTASSGGTYNAATGIWTLTLPAGVTSFSGGPTVSPPANSDADLSSLTVTATATETSNGNAASVNNTMSVVTDAVVDAVTIDAHNASGAEDTVIPLTITLGASADTDGSEELGNIFVSGIPAGFTLNHGHIVQGGNWVLTQAELAGLTISAPKDYNGTLNLTVSVTNADVNLSGAEFDPTDNEMTATDTFTVTFDPAADQPTLSVDDVQVKEDGSVQLVIDAGLTGPATDYLVVKIAGIAAGWGVDTSTSGGSYDAATHTWTITVAAGQNFHGGPTFSPPANSDADMTGLVVTATEVDPIASVSASVSDTASITTDAVVDAITVDAQNASGNEDTNIPLTINIGASADTDGSEHINKILISGVPAGTTLNHGTNQGGGVWLLTQADLTGLTIKPATNWSGTFNLTVAVTNEEANLGGSEYDYTDNKLTVIDTLAVTVNPVADQPNLSVQNVWVKEDGSVQLNISASLNDTDGSERLTVKIAGIASGWTVDTTASGGTYDAATHTWTLTLPAGVNSFTGGPIVKPPANSDADMTGLTVTATATETGNGSTASNNATMSVYTDAVVDPVTVTASNASGNENTAIALSISVGASADTDGSEGVTKVVISGVPTGATLNHGALQSDGTWLLTKADLTGLTLTPASGYHGTFNLTVKVTEQETTLSGLENDLTDNTAVTTATLSVNVNDTIGKPTVTAQDVWVKEDGSVQLNVSASLTNPHAGDILTVKIAGIASGWTVDTTASGGTYDAATHTWTLTLPAGVNSFTGGPIVKPPANSDADMTGLTVTATASDGTVSSSSTATENVYTDAVVDPVTVTASNAVGAQDTAIGLNISIGASADTDGSEHVTKVVISGVPTGATLNHGTLQSDGTWLLNASDLSGLKVTPASGYHGGFNLSVAVTEQETSLSGLENTTSDNTAVATTTLHIDVVPPKLIVGENVDDKSTSSTPYEVGGGSGTINGDIANDILVGDVGGSSMQNVDKDYNVVLILDVSGSMQGTKIALLKQAVVNLLGDLDSYQGGHVKVFIAPFSTGVGTTGTFDLSTANGYASAVSFVNGLAADGYTNYEAPLQSAINWLQGNTSNDPIAGAQTFTYFVSDGEPNRYMNGNTVTTGSADTVMGQITGSDGSNEVATLQAFGEVIGVGIGVDSTTLGRLSVIDSGTDSALNVQDPNDLSAALQGANPLNHLADVGGDTINGGDGNDIIFGDSLNTDALATAQGLTTMPHGSGWGVFTELEAGHGTNAAWTRTDTINYIKTHLTQLAAESTGSGGQVRTGGNDTINGGNGDDTIFGQEGNDQITGGAGNDTLYGGSGADVFVLNAVGQGVDTVKDFNAAQGDVLNIHNILTGFDPGVDDLHNFVRTVSSGGNTLLQVDTNGTGSNYQTVCVLEGVNVDVDTLATHGNLIA